MSTEELEYNSDSGKMKALIERYIELCDTLRSYDRQPKALAKLGTLVVEREGDFEKGRFPFPAR